ncbi:condensation domain-containing protein, partial [Bacillus sp. C1]
NHNKKIYIVNRNHQLQPIGVPGELCIGGEGLARGYWNRADLTEEKFVPNPFVRGERMYKTGDLARWLPDGSIDYIGRIDDQVKIRGHRIEPGEVTRRLLENGALEEVVVLAHTDEKGRTDLCAYFVANQEWSIQELRQYVLEELPEYMVPSYFIELDHIPLTPNGKIDKKALPKPDGNIQTGVEYAPPTNQIEEVLVEIWQEVLNVKQIGIHDNYVELGGDSINAIQISARLFQRNFKLEVNDLFKHPTISELTPYIHTVHVVVEQGDVEGTVSCTPIQEWFFEQKLQEPHHWNQAMMLYNKEGWEPEGIKQAFRKLTEHHDILRAQYLQNGEEIIQTIQGVGKDCFTLQGFNFKQHIDIQQRVEEEANKLQRSIDLEKGPLVRLGLFQTNKGDYLLIIVHHLIIDGVSWRILLQDFDTVYGQLKRKEEINLPLKTHSYQAWSQKLQEYANSKELLKELSYWKEIDHTVIPNLPKYMNDSNSTYFLKDNHQIAFSLTEEQTTKLLTDVHRAYHTEGNQLLITALALTIREWTNEEQIAVSLEGHGREEIIEGVNLSQTIGWFTSIYPAVFRLQSDELSYAIKLVKETLRQIPNKGVGFGILNYLTAPEKKEFTTFKLRPQISFNYLGTFDQKDAQGFGQSSLPLGDFFSPKTRMQHALEINGVVMNGKLQISFIYNKYVYDVEIIEKLVSRYKHYLLAIMNHCLEREENELTPSDFSAKKLSIEELDDIFMELEEL